MYTNGTAFMIHHIFVFLLLDHLFRELEWINGCSAENKTVFFRGLEVALSNEANVVIFSETRKSIQFVGISVVSIGFSIWTIQFAEWISFRRLYSLKHREKFQAGRKWSIILVSSLIHTEIRLSDIFCCHLSCFLSFHFEYYYLLIHSNITQGSLFLCFTLLNVLMICLECQSYLFLIGMISAYFSLSHFFPFAWTICVNERRRSIVL